MRTYLDVSTSGRYWCLLGQWMWRWTGVLPATAPPPPLKIWVLLHLKGINVIWPVSIYGKNAETETMVRNMVCWVVEAMVWWPSLTGRWLGEVAYCLRKTGYKYNFPLVGEDNQGKHIQGYQEELYFISRQMFRVITEPFTSVEWNNPRCVNKLSKNTV